MRSTNWIGRAGAIVEDPYDRWHRAFDSRHAESLDAAATFYGVSLTEKSDIELGYERENFEASLDSPLDFDAAATARRWQDALELAAEHVARAEEEVFLLEGRASFDGRKVASALDKARERLREAQESEYRTIGAYEREGSETYNRDWFLDNREALMGIVAIDRELAIREEMRALHAVGRSTSDVLPGTTFKLIGTEEAALLAERELQRSRWNAHLGRSETPTIWRHNVPPPALLDQSSGTLSREERATLTHQLARLEEWVGAQPDSRVRARYAELQEKDRPPQNDADHELLLQVYAREHEIRRQMDVASAIARALETPSARVVEKLGAPPEKGTVLHHEYYELARDIEAKHLDAASAQQAGVPPHDYDRGTSLRLEDRIDEYRAVMNMREVRAAIEHGGGLDFG